jgi:hypothetical protein
LLLVTDNVPYVMEQVRHDDETTTTRIYGHLIRQRQEHGAAFDRALAGASAGFGASEEQNGFWPQFGLAARNRRRVSNARQLTNDKAPRLGGFLLDAPGRIRTCGLLLRRQALYPLSYGRGRPRGPAPIVPAARRCRRAASGATAGGRRD